MSRVKDGHFIFEKDTCVFHISGNLYDLGKILKFNSAVLRMFDYNKLEMNG